MHSGIAMTVAITCLVWLLLLRSMRATRREDMIIGISQKQVVEVGSSVELECNLENIWEPAEVAWVRVVGVGELEYLSIYNKEEGVRDYDEERFISRMEDDMSWYLELGMVTLSMGGLYQCQVGGVDS